MMALKRYGWIPVLVLVVALLGFVAWAEIIPSPLPEAWAALGSDGDVAVIQDRWIVFLPTDQEPRAGLILYPGGRVDPVAYAPMARSIAADGYLVALVPMPLNLAFTGINKASQVMAAYPEISRWAIGGHSLGGAMAARYVYQNPANVDGLILWAAYPAASDDLSGRDLSVASIYATRDGLATLEKINASRPLLPPDTAWIAIQGGNHAGFGWYGPQRGDLAATIAQEEQQRQIVEATLDLLALVGAE